MTTAEPQHVRPGRLRETWRGFRRWRRVRPFWGGLLTALAGLEIFGTTQMSLGGLSFQMGPTGFLSWLIPTILVTCGLLIWFSPQQRIFYAVVAAVTALFSLIGVNLGGFFAGLLLGMVGSALAFAWTPDRPPTTTPDVDPDPGTDHTGAETAPAEATARHLRAVPAGPEPDAPTLVDEAGPAGDPLRAARPAPSVSEPRPHPPAGPPVPGPRDPRYLAVLLGLVGLSATAALAAPAPARAADPAGRAVVAAPAACPTRPATTGPAAPSRSATPRPSGSASASPSPSPDADEDDGNLITDILEGIGDLFGGGDDEEEQPSASATPTATTTGRPTATGTPRPRPAVSGCPTATPTPRPSGDVEAGEPLPRVAVDPGQPLVNAVPSKLTGSKVTMTGLRFDGIVDLPTAQGTLKALKFSMARAVTDDFLLRVPGPAGRTMGFATGQLTVQGNVDFYATRFVGRLLGIKITLTPDLPFPDGLPITSPIPITFTEPAMDLAFVTSDTLTAKPRLRLTLN
ncbi:DUF6114 domain-containing protein [Micromonospora sp. WMMC415]|uniref:DUF6114 domain-containing protein n=1 Tax=Micromonospora sp. WMMC415 TaxID=2675222 RepID=UPI0018AF73F9|nr:DUF6114 domain-containing protein [Micromonospora sp. WMMC415]